MTKNEIAVKRAEKQSRLQTLLNRGAVVLTIASGTSAANAAASYDTTEIIAK